MATESLEGTRVLLVDDDLGVRRAYTRLLSSAGCKVHAVASGEEAVALIKTTPFDVVLSDIAMPGMNGLEFLRTIREHDLDLPVVLMTGGPALGTAIQAVEYGAFRYLMKPIEEGELLSVLGRAAQLHRMASLKRQALSLLGADGGWLGDRVALEARFTRALETLWIAFQPIVSWSTRRVFGFEALVRNSEPSLARPQELLDVSERLGRTQELSRTIRARIAASATPAPADTRFFVNLHACDLLDDELYSDEAPLTILARRVVLEVTERASLEHVRDLHQRAGALRRLGFQIAVDDLGAGYAGLTSFTQLEPEVVKLDMALVRGVDTLETKQRVIRSMVSLCAEMGIAVVAEGVETPSERDRLVELGCDLMQGYLFAKPAPGFPEPRW
jgi:EAL domain-containing protein (putative c-di-GMP-specific phosphodiesterase class I)/CheY-like chemotaxis protein